MLKLINILFSLCIIFTISCLPGYGSPNQTIAETSASKATRIQMGGAQQGNPLSLAANVSTFTNQLIPIYYGNTENNSITLDTFSGLSGIASDGTNLYITDSTSHGIYKITINTRMTIFLAGTKNTTGSIDGVGTLAKFNNPSDITTDGTNLYVADTGNMVIRKIDIDTGVVTTIAGTAGLWGSKDGTGSKARFNSPSGITTDNINLYVVDTGNNNIRKINIATGEVSTLAGMAGLVGNADGIGSAAMFKNPSGITTDGTNLYVTDFGNGTIRKIVIDTRMVTTIAGDKSNIGCLDAIGTKATFRGPNGITTDGINLYVTDTYNNTIRKIVIATGNATTIAGTATNALPGGNNDGIGAAAKFNLPIGITTDGSNLYVTDSNNHVIRKIQ